MMRKQFEEWFNNEVFSLKLADEKLVNCHWDAWKASRESLEVELPILNTRFADDRFADGYLDALEDIAKSLNNLGVKIK